jgi:site-specific recombinase XerD
MIISALTEAVDAFVAALRARHAPTNTIKAYASDLRRFMQFVHSVHAEAELEQLDADIIRSFLINSSPGMGGRPESSVNPCVSPATRRRRYATLCSFYHWLVRQGMVDFNPMERVDPIETVSRLPRPLDSDVVTAILKAIPPAATRDRALFTLLYETGMRVGEALGLQVADVDLTPDDEKVRVLGKGQRERTVLLTAAQESIRLLRRHLKLSHLRSGSVFRGDPRYGGSALPLDYTTVRRAWQRYCEAAGVKSGTAGAATIHQLRHSRASELVRAGVPLGTVRKVLGHRNIQSTMLYAEVDQATVKHDLLEYQRRKARTR